MTTALISTGRALSAAACLAALASTAVATPLTDRFSSFWVLGDSLSDPGNVFAATGGAIPPSPPYFNGRFSNGPVWADSLTREFEDAGQASGNVAFGGAKAATDDDLVPDLAAQTGLFAGASAGALGDDPLVTLWFGGNDLLAAAREPDAASREAGVEAAVDAIVAGALAISGLGVDEFLIFNVPDVGATPQFQLFEPGNAATATEVTALFTGALAQAIDGLRAEGLGVTEVDVFSLAERVAADPGAFGLTEPVIPCLFPDMTTAEAAGQAQVCTPAEAEERAFFDGVHPNNVVQGLFADAARDALAPVPLPASLPLLLAAIGALGFARRRG